MELVSTHLNFPIKNIVFRAKYEEKLAYDTGKKIGTKAFLKPTVNLYDN